MTPQFEALNHLFIAHRLGMLLEDQYEILVEARGVQSIWVDIEAIEQSHDENALDRLRKWHQVARHTAILREMGVQMTGRQMSDLIKSKGYDLITNLISAARSGQDPGALHRLKELIYAPGPDSAADAGATNRSAPASEEGERNRRFEQLPPPPGRATTQAFDDHRDGDEIAGATHRAERSQAPHRQERPRSAPRQYEQEPRGGYQSRERQSNVRPLRSSSASPRRDERDYDVAGGGESQVIQFDQQNVYSKGPKGASVRFQNSEDRRTNGRFVVFVEMAHINSDGETYNWDDKLSIMLNTSETERVIAVMRGWIDSARFSMHGHDRRKWMAIRKQDPSTKYAGSIQITGGDGDRTFLCNIYPLDQTRMMGVLSRAYAKMMHLDLGTALANLESVAENYRINELANPPSQGAGQGGGRYERRNDRGNDRGGNREPRYGSHRG